MRNIKKVTTTFYNALYKPENSNIEVRWTIWRKVKENVHREYMDANKIANFGRDIMQNNRLIIAEIE